MNTKPILYIVVAAALTACSNMETRSGPFVNEHALRQIGDTANRANAYEHQGYSPRDAWENARYDSIGGPFGPIVGGFTPIAGYGWGIGVGTSQR